MQKYKVRTPNVYSSVQYTVSIQKYTVSSRLCYCMKSYQHLFLGKYEIDLSFSD